MNKPYNICIINLSIWLWLILIVACIFSYNETFPIPFFPYPQIGKVTAKSCLDHMPCWFILFFWFKSVLVSSNLVLRDCSFSAAVAIAVGPERQIFSIIICFANIYNSFPAILSHRSALLWIMGGNNQPNPYLCLSICRTVFCLVN